MNFNVSRRTTVWLAAIIVMVNGFFPAVWILLTSLKSETELIRSPVTYLPEAATLEIGAAGDGVRTSHPVVAGIAIADARAIRPAPRHCDWVGPPPGGWGEGPGAGGSKGGSPGPIDGRDEGSQDC